MLPVASLIQGTTFCASKLRDTSTSFANVLSAESRPSDDLSQT